MVSYFPFIAQNSMESFCRSAEMNASDVILIDPVSGLLPSMESNQNQAHKCRVIRSTTSYIVFAELCGTKIPAFTPDVWFVVLVAVSVVGIEVFLLVISLVVQSVREGSGVWAEVSIPVIWVFLVESLAKIFVSDMDVAGDWELVVVFAVIVLVRLVVAGIEFGVLVVKTSGKVIKLFVMVDDLVVVVLVIVVLVVVGDVVLVVTEVLLVINWVLVVSLVGFLFGVVSPLVDSVMDTTVICPGFFEVEIISAID